MKIKILVILIAVFFCHTFNAQVSTQWASKFNGPASGNDAATCIAVDSAGNVYVGGYSVSASNQQDFMTIKYNAAGEQLWVARYNGTASGNDIVTAIACDNRGNSYVTGSSEGVESGFDYCTIKYNYMGEEVWVARFNGTKSTNDGANAILIDISGSVYVTGYSTGEETSMDIVTIKYSPTGEISWRNSFDNPKHLVDYGACMKKDSEGNIYVGGYSETEFAAHDFVLLKISPAGNSLWNQKFNGSGNKDDEIKAIGLDASANVYATGTSYGAGTNKDIVTLKYNTRGELQWQAAYNGPGNNIDAASDMIVDKNGNVYVTGTSLGKTTNFDYCTIKYNSQGAELWVSRYNDMAGGADNPTCIALDGTGSVYVSGYVWNGVDNDYATVKYNPLGTEIWVAKYNGAGNALDMPTAINADNKGNVYVTGFGVGSTAKYDFETIKYGQTPPENSPNIISPAYGTSGLSRTPDLIWSPMRNADYFRLQISTNKNFSSFVLDSIIFISDEQCSVPDNVLSDNTQYYWRIGAVNSAGSGPWSASSLFSVLSAPEAPILISPANGLPGIPLAPVLKWQKVASAVKYRVQVSKDCNFTELVQNEESVTANEFKLPAEILADKTIYFWRVGAENAEDILPWSQVWSFGTGKANPPGTPVLLSLPDSSTGQPLTPVLDWQDVPSTAAYKLQVASDSNFSNIVIDESNLSNSEFAIPAGVLLSNMKYFWRVSAVNPGGTGSWSRVWSFSCMLSGLQKVGSGIPKEFKLYDNLPEPFVSVTAIRFDIPNNLDDNRISLVVYDLSGKEFARLVDEKIRAGSWVANWDGSRCQHGYYLYQLQAGTIVETKKMQLTK